MSVKESVFPFAKFPGVDIVLGPEMRSTGEVMGIDTTFAAAFAKSQMAASCRLPDSGTVFVSVAARDRQAIVPIAARLASMGYDLMGTIGDRRGAGLARDHRRPRSARSPRGGRTSSTTWPTAGSRWSSTPPAAKEPGPTRAESEPPPSATESPASPPSPAPRPPSPPSSGSARAP